ncbi:MAG TPA: lysophospholipid acyltransferase family protein, partial [Reyranella sp.]
MRAVQAVRTAIFYALFIGQTVVLAIAVGLIAIIWKRRTAVGWGLAMYWRNSNVAMLRWIVGIDTAVSGQENVPAGPCIIASKHQSDWDIFAILPVAVRPAFIAKRELIDIPFFGWAAQSIDTISIDRRLGALAIPRMLEDARAALDRGCRIVIYPEGTRKAPLADADYRQGITRLYGALKVPVVPVALDSGLYWGRNSGVMWPGTARAKFLPPILPGLTNEAFAAQLQLTIETETTRMIGDAVEKGIARPLGAAFRAKLAERLAA